MLYQQTKFTKIINIIMLGMPNVWDAIIEY